MTAKNLTDQIAAREADAAAETVTARDAYFEIIRRASRPKADDLDRLNELLPILNLETADVRRDIDQRLKIESLQAEAAKKPAMLAATETAAARCTEIDAQIKDLKNARFDAECERDTASNAHHVAAIAANDLATLHNSRPELFGRDK